METIKDQFPKNWPKTTFKTAVINTKSAICLLSFMDGIKMKLSDAKGAAQETFSKVKTSAKGSIDKIKSKVKAKNQ